MMRHTMITAVLIMVVSCAGLQAAALTGVINDVDENPVDGAEVTLTDMVSHAYDSTVSTDSTGGYAFGDYPISNYKLSVTKAGYNPKDTALLLGSGDKVVNITLLPVSYHYGEVSGTWLPADNPHRVIDNITIKDSLYIAPGCSVVFEDTEQDTITGKLTIGANDGSRTYITNCAWVCLDDYPRSTVIRIENTTIAGLLFVAPAKELYLDSVTYNYGNSPIGYIRLYAEDTLAINRTVINRGTQPNMVSGEFYSTLTAIGMEGNIFNDLVSVNIRNMGGAESVALRYCIINSGTFGIGSTGASTVIQHCNLPNLGVNGDLSLVRDRVTVENCIIRQINFNDCTGGDIYNSPFSYNVVTEGVQYNTSDQVLGLLTPIRTNTQGDSCDLWYNMKVDPLVMDSTTGRLDIASPCLDAASDGTNIGCWQGTPEGIRDWYHVSSDIPLFSNVPYMMFDVNGKVIRDNRVQTGVYFTVGGKSKTMKKMIIRK